MDSNKEYFIISIECREDERIVAYKVEEVNNGKEA